MRNPPWHRDEIILALDLYFSPDRGSIDDKNKRIQELSFLINSLPLFEERPDEGKFRNANGVTLKLSNFLALDPNYTGKGMTGGSKLDKIVFDEYFDDKPKLRAVALQIKNVVANPELKRKISLIEEDEQSRLESVREGNVLYKYHKVRERDPRITKLKKEQAYDLFGKLQCEVCDFVFKEFYGDIGNGFIECHHRIPLYSSQVGTQTTLDDLSLVCPNCHRMLHRRIDIVNVEVLKEMLTRGGD